MQSNASHNKRIAKNSLLLYVKLFITMAVSLYTSRIILAALGDVDFGIYSVVAGVVIMIAFLNNSLVITTQRFLNYEMGRPGTGNLSAVFSTAVISHYAIAAVVVVVAETAGLWFLKTHMNISPERMGAALVVFHASVATLAVKIIGSPYNAAIIANERMRAFSIIAIAESVLTLLLALLLVMLPHDKLAAYGMLTLAAAIATRLAYVIYCRRNFAEYKFRFVFDRGLLATMFSFTGWMFTGTFAGMLSSQGLNILINIYFGPLLNTARTIAVKVQGTVQSLVDSLITAVQPQIVKSYSAGDTGYMNRLVFTSSKLSFFIVMLFSLPVLINTEPLLRLWLGQVPEYSVLFTRLILIDTLITCSFAPIGTISQASGKIKFYQAIVSVSLASIFLLTWLSYRAGFPVYYAFVISIAVNFAALFARLAELKRSTGFNAGHYIRRVLLPEIAVLAAAAGTAFIVTRLIGRGTPVLAAASAAIYLPAALAAIYWGGLDRAEKKFSKNIYETVIRRNK